MSNNADNYQDIFETFGVEIRQSAAVEASNIRHDLSARETIEHLEAIEDSEAIYAITYAINEISKVVRVNRVRGDRTEEMIDLFTAEQLLDMHKRVRDYLGAGLDEFMAADSKPVRHDFYVDRLGMYFFASDSSVTTNFSQFENRHTNPAGNARGPHENNSRRYANLANEIIIRNLTNFYQTEFNIELLGPTKLVNGSRVWTRGIAEAQFLILDYIAVQAAQGFEQRVRLPNSVVSMTIEDIAANITSLVANRRFINSRVKQINPIIADQIDQSIASLAETTQEVIHRGRWGARQYEREPKKVQSQILRIESLLTQAVSLEYIQGQEEIPVLDLELLAESPDG